MYSTSQGVVQKVQDTVEVRNEDRGDGGIQVRSEAGEGGKEVLGVHMNVEEGKGPTTRWILPVRTSWTVEGRRNRVARMRSLEACWRVEAVRVYPKVYTRADTG